MRLYPPTAGMSTFRFILQILTIHVVLGVARIVCWIYGHAWGEVYTHTVSHKPIWSDEGVVVEKIPLEHPISYHQQMCDRCQKVKNWETTA